MRNCFKSNSRVLLFRLGVQICILISLIQVSSAQVVTVNVTDKSGIGLPGAYVFVFDTLDRNIVDNIVSDSHGEAVLNFSGNDMVGLLIKVELLGYKNIEIILREQKDTSHIRVVLEPLPYILSMAEVSAKRRISSINNNDTTSIDIESYRDSMSSNIIDVLKSDPNISELPSGDLTYRGQKVNRIFIDGRDVFGQGQYSEPLSRLRPSIMSSAEAIENYHEDEVLSRLEQSSETVINLTSTNEAQDIINGSAITKHGATKDGQWRFENSIDLVNLRKKYSLYASIGYSKFSSLRESLAERFENGESLNIGSIEPIGKSYANRPVTYSAWISMPRDAPLSLVGDARISNLKVTANFSNSKKSRNRLSISQVNQKDRAARFQSMKVGDFSLETSSDNKIRDTGYFCEFSHYNAIQSGRTSWKLNAKVELVSSRSMAFHKKGNMQSGLKDYLHSSNSSDEPVSVGGRVNHLLGDKAALQIFATVDKGVLVEDSFITVDSSTVLEVGLPSSAILSIRQERSVDYLASTAGVNLFFRNNLGSGKLYTHALRQESLGERSLWSGSDAIKNSSESKYQSYKIGVTHSMPLRTSWILNSKASYLLVKEKIGSQISNGFAYKLGLSNYSGKQLKWKLKAAREILLPVLTYEVGVPVLSSPFAIERPSYSNSPILREYLAFNYRGTIPDVGIDYKIDAEFLYNYRRTVDLFTTEMNRLTVDRAAVISGQSTSLECFLNLVSVATRTVSKVRIKIIGDVSESTLTSFTGKVKRSGHRAIYNLTLPRFRGLMSEVEFFYQADQTRIGSVSRSIYQSASLAIGYPAGKFIYSVESTYARTHTALDRIRSFSNLSAHIYYTTKEGPDGWIWSLSATNLTNESRVARISASETFLELNEVNATGLTVMVGLNVPLTFSL